MRNLEYKARIDDTPALMRQARELGANLWGDLRQTDTYFEVAPGRLKLRETAGFQAELIYYEREETAASRPSNYEIAQTPDAAAMREVLSKALGVTAVVRKRRTLLLLDTTRIHLDNVDELGAFIEIEVPVRDDEMDASKALDALIGELGLSWESCIRASYVDLMREKREPSP